MKPEPLRLLTLRHPWMWAILNGKHIENRRYAYHEMHNGTVHLALHGGVYDNSPRYHREIRAAMLYMERKGILPAHSTFNDSPHAFVRTGICAIARIERISTDGHLSSNWAVEGQKHWHLVDVREITPLKHDGAQGAKPLPDDTARELWARYAEGRPVPASETIERTK